MHLQNVVPTLLNHSIELFHFLVAMKIQKTKRSGVRDIHILLDGPKLCK